MPDKSLIEVPELPQSRVFLGAEKFFGAFKISVRSSIKLTSQPRFFIISRVALQSAPNEKLEISLSDLTKIDDIINLIYNLKDLDPKDYLKNMDEFMNSKRAYTIKKPYEIRDEYVLVSRIFPMAKIQSKMEELNIEISDIVCVDNQEETLLEEVEEAAKIKDKNDIKVKRLERR